MKRSEWWLIGALIVLMVAWIGAFTARWSEAYPALAFVGAVGLVAAVGMLPDRGDPR